MSDLEDLLCHQIRAVGLPKPEREYRFHPARRFRFDVAWPDRMLAVEVDGGNWVNGAHNRGSGRKRDNEKQNLAVLGGWRVLRFTGTEVKTGEALAAIEEAFKWIQR